MNLFRSMTEESRLLIWSWLPQIKGFFVYRDWVYRQLKSAEDEKDSYAITAHAQNFLLRFTVGPLRWILWALLSETHPLMMRKLLDRVEVQNVALDPYLRDAIYGDSLRDEIQPA